MEGLIDNNGYSKLNDDDVRLITEKLDIVALVETHIGDDSLIQIKGYSKITSKFRKKSNNNRYFGGLTILAKTNIKNGIEIIDHSSNEDRIWIKLTKEFFCTENDIYLCACYIPPDNSLYLKSKNIDILDMLEDDITTFPAEANIIICGDLNSRTGNLSESIRHDDNRHIPLPELLPCDTYVKERLSEDRITNARGKQLLDFCLSTQLKILNGRKLGDSLGYFTCHKYNGSSVADYMLVSKDLLDKVFSFSVHKYIAYISDHCCISAVLNITPKRTVPRSIKLEPHINKVNFNAAAVGIFQKLMSTHETSERLLEIQQHDQNLNNQVSELNKVWLTAASKAGVIKSRLKTRKTRNSKGAKWHDQQYLQLKRTVRQLSYQTAKNPFDKQLRNRAFVLLKKLRKLNKNLKKTYIRNIVNRIEAVRDNDPQTYWKIIDELKQVNTQYSDARDTADSVSPEKWVQYYTDLNLSKVPINTDSRLKDVIKTQESNLTFSEIDYRITEKEILEAVKKLKNGKAVGSDGVSNEMVKYSITNTLPTLLSILNKIYSSSEYPKQWGEVMIHNIYKSGDPQDPFNYRGISIGSALAKLFSTIMNTRLIKFLVSNNLLSKCQIGFVEGCRTSDHIFAIKTIIDKYRITKKKDLYMCFVDFKKAFDTIWHTGLLYKLQQIGINGLFYKMIKDMYTKVRCKVKTKDGLTPSIASNVGVRQGDVLSPMLFNIYINDIAEILDKPQCDLTELGNAVIRCLMYADDLVLISTSRNGLQHQLDILQEYCQKWHLTVNIQKTKVMAFTKKQNIDTFNYDGNSLEKVDTFPYLGVLLNTKGDFSNNNERLSNKGLRALHKLWKSWASANLSIRNQIKLFDHTIKPILMYATEVTNVFNTQSRRQHPFEDLKCEDVSEKVHKKFMRHALGLNNKTTIDAIYSEFGRYPFYIERITRMLKYEKRFHMISKDTILYQAYMEDKSQSNKSKNSWHSCLSYIRKKLNIPEVINNETVRYANKTLKDNFQTQWSSRIHNDTRDNPLHKNKLRTFRLFKYIYQYEPYLDIITDFETRKSFCKFRISSHRLNIELGRHQRIEIEKRICNKCSMGAVEDEIHAAMHCSKFDKSRQELFKTISQQNDYFNAMDERQKFIWMFSNEDRYIIQAVSKFVHKIMTYKE